MTAVQVRAATGTAVRPNDVLLDLFADDEHASTIRCKPDFFRGMDVGPTARDLFTLAGAVFCADKTVLRSATPDGWTRSFEIDMEVADPQAWENARADLVAMLQFLSGDRYELTFRARTDEPAAWRRPRRDTILPDADCVCLFSGGLDSLTGAIDLLADGHRVRLVGHHESSLAESRQGTLQAALAAAYPDADLHRRALYLRPHRRRPEQAQPLPRGAKENTSRSRSFLFVAAAVAAADAIGPGIPVHMPENGFIGVNVPLTASRAGSLSTRTTHPLYIHYFRRVLAALRLDHPIENPFRLRTKGELLVECVDPDLLRRLAPQSVSCSHPETKRFHQSPHDNCGTCYPCLIRRSAMHHAGLSDDYVIDALTDGRLLHSGRIAGASLRALAQSLTRPEHVGDVLANGRIPGGEAPDFFGVWQRGREELRTWLDQGASAELRRRYA